MNGKKFSDAMSELDAKYIDEALHYQKKAKRSVWLTWGATAACLCVLVLGVSHFLAQSENGHGADIEPGIELTLEEAANHEPFGKLFPSWIFEDYALEGSVGIFGDTVLSARFYSASHVDELLIQITDREWFDSQHPDLELNTILYRETTRGPENQIYIDGGDSVVLYSCIVSMKNNKANVQRRVRCRTQNGAASHRTGYNMGTTTDKAREQERTVLHEGGIDHAKIPADMFPILAEKWLQYR